MEVIADDFIIASFGNTTEEAYERALNVTKEHSSQDAGNGT